MAVIRAGVTAIVLSCVLAPAAWPCEQPSGSGKRERIAGEAGEKVRFEIPNTLEGADWLLRIEDGDELAHGEDEDANEGATVEFEVPDLGQEARTVDLLAEVRHDADGADWTLGVKLHYRGRPADEPAEDGGPVTDSEPSPEPPPQPVSQPAPEGVSDSQAIPASGAPPSPPAPPPAAPADSVVPVPPSPGTTAAPAGAVPPPVPAARTEGGAVAPPSSPVGRDARVSAQRRARRARGAGSRAASPAPAAPVADAPRQITPAEEGGVRLPDVDVPGFGAGMAWGLIVAGGIAFAAAGLGLSGLARHRRRRRLALR